MANGKPGDGPLTDILVYGLEVYGKQTDDLIRRISALSSPRELEEWWAQVIGWKCHADRAHIEAEKRLTELVARAKANGWEL